VLSGENYASVSACVALRCAVLSLAEGREQGGPWDWAGWGALDAVQPELRYASTPSFGEITGDCNCATNFWSAAAGLCLFAGLFCVGEL